jgi:hypothetical protein
LVNAIAAIGSTVYVGGEFTSIGGQPRSRIAALGVMTGQASAWDPGANGTVAALAVSGNIVYAGGWFTSIGGQARGGFCPSEARAAGGDGLPMGKGTAPANESSFLAGTSFLERD